MEKTPDIIAALDYLRHRRHPPLWSKFLLALQNYVLEHYLVYITTDDAKLIIRSTENGRLDWWLDENDNVTIDDFPELIGDFMAYVELCRR